MSDFVGRFQPYTLSILDSHSLGGFSSRYLVTFPSRRRRSRFRHFLRHKCRARRRGNWVIILGASFFGRAVDYAAHHGSYVYSLPVKRTPSHRRWVQGEVDSEGEEFAQSEDENVPETDLLSDDEN